MSIKLIIRAAAATFVAGIAGCESVQRMAFNAIRLNRPESFRLWSNRSVRFLSYVFANRAKSHAQIMQDLWVCFELLEKRGGFFVEFGATNGRTNSNTWLLEHEFGWRGILAEPNPFWHTALAANRQSAIEYRCVASATGETVSFIATDDFDPELSGIAGFSQGTHFEEARNGGRRIEVETISLNDLLHKFQAPPEIDYMSIDTEGNEFEILSTFDFERHHVRLFSIEHNLQSEARIQTLLESKGYVRVFRHFAQWDSWYVDSNLNRSPPHLIVAPAN